MRRAALALVYDGRLGGGFEGESHVTRWRVEWPWDRWCDLKEESHAARWGLMRGYSGKATKWVDFVRTGSTQRKREEPCPKQDSNRNGHLSQEIYGLETAVMVSRIRFAWLRKMPEKPHLA